MNRGAVIYSVAGPLVGVAGFGCTGMLVSNVKLVVAGAVGAGSGAVTGWAAAGGSRGPQGA